MKTYPIIFSASMVHALLDGSKTQTRRIPTRIWESLKLRHDAGEPCYLWVREKVTYAIVDQKGNRLHDSAPIYFADEPEWDVQPKWKSPLFMPRSDSRLTLEVTDVRVQKLQEISIKDAHAEGIGFPDPMDGGHFSATGEYGELWESLHGAGSWEANPTVVAISFRVYRKNIDELIGERT